MFNDSRLRAALRLFMHNISASTGSVIGVIAIVFLVGVQIATLFGVIDITANVIRHSGVDFWVVTKNTVNLDHSGDMPMNYVDRASGLEEVLFARPLVNAAGLMRDKTGRRELSIMFGLKPPYLTGGPWIFYKGQPSDLLDPFATTLDDTTLDFKYHPQINQLIDYQQKKLRITSFTKHIRTFRGDAVFASEFNAHKVQGNSQFFNNAVLIKLKKGVDHTEARRKLEALFPFATIFDTAKLADSTTYYYLFSTGVGGSLYLSTTLAALIGIVIIALTLYNNILTYDRDIAILRALGARRIDIFIIIFYQVLIMALIGSLIGFLMLAFALNVIVDTRVPIALPIWFGPVHFLSTLILCILGSIFAVRHALKIDPATVFR